MSANLNRRYSRQMQLPEIGLAGQQKLSAASVLLIGIGGLGSPAALYLSSAGVGRLGLIDFDRVDISNLHRQIIYDSENQDSLKADSAAARLRSLNPEIEVEVFSERLSLENALSLFSQYDYILDGADNFATRFLVNDAAYFASKPLVSASVLGFEGQISTFERSKGPCYRCLFPEPPPPGLVPSCAEAGVLGTMPGWLGVWQAHEVLKLILGIGQSLHGRLILCDGMNFTTTALEISKNPDCPLCGDHPKIHELKEEFFVCHVPQGSGPVFEELAVELFQARSSTTNYQILDVREDFEVKERHLEYTHHIPLAELAEEFSQLSQETPVIVYCKSGGRSASACELLQKKGFHAINLKGGITAWIEKFG